MTPRRAARPRGGPARGGPRRPARAGSRLPPGPARARRPRRRTTGSRAATPGRRGPSHRGHDPGREVRQVGVGDGYPLRPAGRAGGVDGVGEAFRLGAERGRQDPVLRQLLVHQDHGGLRLRQALREPTAGHHHGRAAIGQQVGLALPRVGGVERHEGGAGLRHREEGDDQLGRALQGDGYQDVRAGAEAQQAPRQPLRPRVELAAGKARAVSHDGRGFGLARCQGRERLVDEEARRLPLAPLVPLQPDLVSLGRGEKGKLAQRPLRRRRRRREQRFEMAHQAQRGGGVEKIGVVLQASLDAVRQLDGGEAEVERRHLLAQGDRPDGEPARGIGGIGRRRLAAGEHLGDHLEQRVAAGVALGGDGLDQPLERQVAVGEAAEGGLANLGQQAGERQPCGDRARRASMLTKKPTSPSSSRRSRLEMGEPTTTSSCPE